MHLPCLGCNGCPPVRILGRAPLDGKGALPVERERASAKEDGARYHVVFKGLAWRPGGQEASESTPRQFQVLVYSASCPPFSNVALDLIDDVSYSQ